MRRFLLAIALLFGAAGILPAQTENPGASVLPASAPVKIALDVPAGTPLPVVLDKELRIRNAGQAIHGKIAEPVYAFDKMVVPAGSEVTGRVTRISSVPALKRVASAMDANFTPYRAVEITFDQLALPDGRRVALRTQVSPASQGVLQFAVAADAKNPTKEKKENASVKGASAKASEAKQEISRDWETAKGQLTAPGKLHRLKRLLIAELPFHPQYLDAGTRFNAELLDSLNFGDEEASPEKFQMVGTAPADGSIIHAILKTPLNSATAQKGEQVEALMTEPLFTDNRLILPEGTELKGSVLQAQPARRLHRNGQLRIVFHEVTPPNSARQQVEASLEGVEVKDSGHLTLDSEGGAQTTDQATKYLKTGISLALVAVSYWPDADAGSGGSQSVLEIGTKGLDGASGFNILGFVIGAAVHSRPLAEGFSVYGAGMSVYANFLSRGHDVVYPKDTAMAIGFGSRVTGAPKARPQT